MTNCPRCNQIMMDIYNTDGVVVWLSCPDCGHCSLPPLSKADVETFFHMLSALIASSNPNFQTMPNWNAPRQPKPTPAIDILLTKIKRTTRDIENLRQEKRYAMLKPDCAPVVRNRVEKRFADSIQELEERLEYLWIKHAQCLRDAVGDGEGQ